MRELNFVLYLRTLERETHSEARHFVIKRENETNIILQMLSKLFKRSEKKKNPFPRNCLKERENETE